MPAASSKTFVRWAVAALFLSAAFLTFYRLDAFPGLHGDEAWVGLFAQRLRERGFYTPHLMNTYTGAFYGWIVAQWFSHAEVSVYYLRLTSAIGNLAAASWMLFFFARRFGARAALAWCYLLATSALYLYAAHIAWEVCALQNLALAGVFAASAGLLDDKKAPAWAPGLLFLSCYLGALNHFIFLSVPLSLCVYAFCREVYHGKSDGRDFAPAAAANLLLAALVYFVKPLWTEENWPKHSGLYLSALAAAPLLAAAAFPFVKEALRRAFDGAAAFFKSARARRNLARFLAAALLVFAFFHAAPLVQIFSNAAVFKRTASWPVPFYAAAALYAWALWILGGACRFAYERRASGGKLAPVEAFVLFWPFAYASIYTIFRHTSSIRYYLIPYFLFLACAAFVPARRTYARPRLAGAGALAAFVFLGFCYVSEMRSPSVRPPIRFKIGWRTEKSADFMSKEPVYRFMAENRICRLDQDESMLDIPIMFRRHARPHECDLEKSVAVSYCWECRTPPYFKWKVSRRDVGP